MGFWNKLGKIALTAAPYIAAPFTGGASLLATGLANKAVQKWSESDARKNAERGIAPSKFDKYLGMAGNIAGMATPFMGGIGALGGLGGAATSAASKGGALANIGKGALGMGKGWQGALGQTLGNVAINSIGRSGQNQSGQSGGYGGNQFGPTNTGIAAGVMPRGGYSYNQNPMNQVNQNNPNLAMSIFQGRQEALGNPLEGGQNYMPPSYATGIGPRRRLQMSY